MDLKIYKSYTAFILSVIFFITIIFLTAYIYIKWDEPIIAEKNPVEVNLPIMNWASYNDLSKQYTDDIIIKE